MTKLTNLRTSVVLLLMLLGWVSFTSYRGIDFGFHADEHFHFEAVEQSIENWVFLPKFYNYPSITYWLTLSAGAPDVAKSVLSGHHRFIEVAPDWLDAVHSHAYRLRVRMLFVFVSLLSVIWIYLTLLVLRRSPLEALFGAALLGLSWEFAYHIRWIAPDAVMMQFAALTLLLCMCRLKKPKERGWITGAAIAAALTTGSKYPGGAVFLPVLITAFLTREKGSFTKFTLEIGRLGLLFCVTYILTTPGTLLDPKLFQLHLRHGMAVYASGDRGNTVIPGLSHLGRMMTYFSLFFFSPFKWLSGVLFAFSLVGAYRVWRESKSIAAVLFSFPVLYLLYFSRQKVMIVRNLLIFAPLLVILGSTGGAYLFRRLRTWNTSAGRWTVFAFMTALLFLNGGWLFESSESIAHRGLKTSISELVSYIKDHPDQQFSLSNQVKDAIGSNLNGIPNIGRTDASGHFAYAIFFAKEVDRVDWPSFWPDLRIQWFGPKDVNMNYYPSCNSAPDLQIIMLPVQELARLGV